MRKVELLAGNRMTREANAGAPKGDGKDFTNSGYLLAVVVLNRPDTSCVLGPRGSPRGSGEFVKGDDDRDVRIRGDVGRHH